MTTKAFLDERIAKLNLWQEVMLHRILIACDENGTLNADPTFIRDTLFPLKTDLRLAQVTNALVTLNSVGLIALEKNEHGTPTLLTVISDQERTLESKALLEKGRGEHKGVGININNINKHGENEGNEDEIEGTDITQTEVDTYRESFDAIEEQARKFGLNTSTGALEMAMELVAEYGLEWVLKAISLSVDTPKWTYVKGILKSAKERGGIEKKKRKGKWFSNDDFDPSALEKWGGSL